MNGWMDSLDEVEGAVWRDVPFQAGLFVTLAVVILISSFFLS